MPPRTKQSGRRQAGKSPAIKQEKKTVAAMMTTHSDSENEPPQDGRADANRMAPPKMSARSARNKSRETANSKLDESMKSTKSINAPNRDAINPAALQAQQELEIQQAFARTTEEIVAGGHTAATVSNVLVRSLVMHMRKSPALFQKTLLAFIERLLTLDVDPSMTRNFQVLLMHTYSELIKERDRANGVKLIKSVLRHLLEIYGMPKIMLALQVRVAVFIANLIQATSVRDAKNSNINHDASQGLNSQLQQNQVKPPSSQRTFLLLDVSGVDQELRKQLEDTVSEMLLTTTQTALQSQGIQIASCISNHKDDLLFKQLMKLLMKSTSVGIRRSIIKSLRAPYSAPALAFLGKRLRDVDLKIVEDIFNQMTSNKVSIKDFPTPEARMLVLTEGLTSHEPRVRDACIKFLSPTVLDCAKQHDIAGVLKLIEARLAFGNQYFGRMPALIVLAILEILEQDVTLADYLDKVVLRKLRRLAGLPLEKKQPVVVKVKAASGEEIDDIDQLFGGKKETVNNGQQDEDMVSHQSAEADKFRDSELDGQLPKNDDQMEVDQATGIITFEEVLLLRLAYEMNRGTQLQRTPCYVDRLAEIIPEFDEYRQILFALAKMDEINLPVIDPKDETINPYPKGQSCFGRRAVLGEWIKFSLQMNIKDEIIRNNLTSLCFELVGKIDHSFGDYEHLLKKRTQLLNSDDQATGAVSRLVSTYMNDDDEVDSDIEGLLDRNNLRSSTAEIQQETENQNIEIMIRSFDNIGTARTLQEYCKPFAMETLTCDYDDVCQMAVTVAKTLLADRVEEFQLKIMEAISDIQDTIQENEQEADQFAAHKQGMFFSQIPQQQQEIGISSICYPKIRAKFMIKLQQKVDSLQALGADEDNFDINTFNNIYKQIQIYVSLIEETNLKEKLSYKRALILCRSLLKQCRIANINDQNVISICENIVHPCVERFEDKEKLLLAFECIGLFSILDKELFLNYSKIFTQILEEELGPDKDNKREKVIAIKSVVDGLIIHGIKDDQLDQFFTILTENYLTVKDRVLRQVTIEGVCKMLFSPKLCEQNDTRRVEAVLGQLIIQQFDKQYSPKNSLVSSILSEFIKNFAPFSEQRCHMLLNAVGKVVYAGLREKYGLSQQIAGTVNQKGRKGKKGKKGAAAVKKRYQEYSDSESDDDVFEESFMDYASDDSQFLELKVGMAKILSVIDLVQVAAVMMSFLSRLMVNSFAGNFKLKEELTVVFFERLLDMNQNLFDKTQIVKDFLQHVLSSVRVETCDSLSQLRKVDKKWARSLKLLVQTTPKVSKFQDRLNQRIQELEEIEEANQQCSVPQIVSKKEGADVEMDDNVDNDVKAEESDDGRGENYDLYELGLYWNEHIADKIVDKGRQDDRELLQMQQIWLDQIERYNTSGSSSTRKRRQSGNNSATKSILRSPSNFNRLLATDSASPKKQAAGAGIRARRAKRGAGAAQQDKVTSAINLGGRVVSDLHSIKEEPGLNSALPRQRRVRIIEEKKSDKHQARSNKRSRGPVKSEVSEEEDEDDSDSEAESGEESDESNGRNSSYSMTVTDEEGRASRAQADQSSSQQDHEAVVKDNLGCIAKNIAHNFAKNSSKRLSMGSNQPNASKTSADTLWQQGKGGTSTLKLDGLSSLLKQEVVAGPSHLQSADKASSQASISREQDLAVLFKGEPEPSRGSSSGRSASGSNTQAMKKKLIRDFNLSDNDVKLDSSKGKPDSMVSKPESVQQRKPQPKMMTRRRQRSQSSRSLESSHADETSEDNNMFDFMDGKLTKQFKQQKKQAMVVKEEPSKGKKLQVAKKEDDALNQSNTSMQSKTSMRIRPRRNK